MAMSKGTSHYNRQSWEDSDFPILCQTCLGDNPYVRMMKEKFGSECKICQRPFTTYRWCPGHKMRYKKTEVCQTCARAKNVCQTCLLDLVYGLPVQVRDSVLSIQQQMPKDEVNREFFNQNLDRQIKSADPKEAWGPHKAQAPSDALAKLARSSPYYKRNRAHVCSFWVKGSCQRGEECPYRHEKPTDPDDPLSDQNIRDRYYGNNDPVADKLLKRISEMPKPQPPEDKSITTLYVGNVGDKVSEQDLRDHFYQYGEIRSVTLVAKQNCAFVTYTNRSAAELAVEKSFQKLIIHGQRLIIRWGKSLAKRGEDANEEKNNSVVNIPGLPVGTPDYFNLGSSSASSASASSASGSASASTSQNANASTSKVSFYYPSQDPSRLGTIKQHNQH